MKRNSSFTCDAGAQTAAEAKGETAAHPATVTNADAVTVTVTDADANAAAVTRAEQKDGLTDPSHAESKAGGASEAEDDVRV